MKLLAWVLTALSLVPFLNEEAAAFEGMGHVITTEGIGITGFTTSTAVPHRLYPGQYTIHILIGKDQVGCSLRVGTKSSNTQLLRIRALSRQKCHRSGKVLWEISPNQNPA